MSAVDLVAEVRDLLARVARAPDQPSPGGAGEDDLADLARRLGRPLPADLAAWLRICRGEAIGPGGLFGARPDLPWLDIERRLSERPGWTGCGWLPIAGDGCGNVYVLIDHGQLTGMAGFVDAISDPDRIGYLVASDLWHFLRFLLAYDLGERGWPFQPLSVLAADPQLTHAPDQLLPWMT